MSYTPEAQYTEGDTDATITGTAVMWEDTADTLEPVSAAKPLPVGDGGGSITVDGPLTDTQLRATPVPVSGTVTITDGSGPVTVDGAVTVSGTATVSGTVAVSSITTSVIPGTSATHLGKAEDAGHTTGDTGVMALGVRNDTRASLAGTDGDYVPPQMNSSGDMRVDASVVSTSTDSFGTGILGALDDAVTINTNGCSTATLVLGIQANTVSVELSPDNGVTWVGGYAFKAGSSFHATPPVTAIVPQGATSVWFFRCAGYSRARVRISTYVSGTTSVSLNAGAGTGVVSVDVVAPGTGAAFMCKSEDTAHTSGDVGVLDLTVRNDSASGTYLAGTDGDYQGLQSDSQGNLKVGGSHSLSLGKIEDSGHTTGDVGVSVLTVRNDASAAAGLAGTDLDYQAQQSDAQGRVRVIENLPVVVSGTLTRPANTTTYTTNDELTDTGGAILAIAGCARYNGGAGYIEAITVIGSVNAATDPSLDIFVFDTTSTPAADNAAFAPSDAVMQTIIVAKNLGTALAGDTATTGNLVWQLSGLRIPFVCGASSTSLFVRFAVRNGYVPPSNSETYLVRLHCFQQ